MGSGNEQCQKYFFAFKLHLAVKGARKNLLSILFVCPIITHEPLNRFVSNLDWGTRENHGNVLSLVIQDKLVDLYRK